MKKIEKSFMKYVELLPVFLYPYLLLIILYLCSLFNVVMLDNEAIIIFFVVYSIYCFVASFYYSKNMTKEGSNNYLSAKENILLKVIHIPAYVFHLLMIVYSFFNGAFDLKLVLWLVVTDIISLLLSGIHSIGLIYKLYRDNYYDKFSYIIFIIGSFFYIFDVTLAVYLLIITKRGINEKEI